MASAVWRQGLWKNAAAVFSSYWTTIPRSSSRLAGLGEHGQQIPPHIDQVDTTLDPRSRVVCAWSTKLVLLRAQLSSSSLGLVFLLSQIAGDARQFELLLACRPGWSPH